MCLRRAPSNQRMERRGSIAWLWMSIPWNIGRAGRPRSQGRHTRTLRSFVAVVAEAGCGAAFATTAQHGNDLSRIQNAEWIEGRAHSQHRAHIVVGKNQRQQFALV